MKKTKNSLPKKKPSGSGPVKKTLEQMTRPELVQRRADLQNKITKIKGGSKECQLARLEINRISILLEQRARDPFSGP